MSRTIEQIRHILQGSRRWNAGLEWYDFLLAIEFHRDGTGEMLYGENQDYAAISLFTMKSLLTCRSISSSLGCRHTAERCLKELRRGPLKQSRFICSMVHLSLTNPIIISAPIVTSCALLPILFQRVKGTQTNHCLTTMVRERRKKSRGNELPKRATLLFVPGVLQSYKCLHNSVRAITRTATTDLIRGRSAVRGAGSRPMLS